MAEIALDDAYHLSKAEQSRLDLLLSLEPPEFDRQVRRWATDAIPNESEQTLFRHPELVQLTLDSLTRLIGRTQREQQSQRDPLRRSLLNEEIKQLGRARKAVRPYVHTAIFEANKGSVRERAEKVLGRIYVVERRAIERDIKAGMSVPQAEAAARARQGSA